ncbi:hypothetical protein ACLB2K_055006 [Fragaria x ananassa]
MSSSSWSTSQRPQQVSISMPVQLSGWQNYFLWKTFIIPVLNSHDILDLAEGRELCPPQFLSSSEDNKEGKEIENFAYSHWIKKDQTLLAVINASLSHDLLFQHAMRCTSGRALWLIFEDLFAQSATTHLKQLKDRLNNLHINIVDKYPYWYPNSPYTYVRKAEKIVKGLYEAGFPVEDREVVSCLLKGLTLEYEEYEEFKASIRGRPEPLSREELYVLLRRLELPKSIRDHQTSRQNRIRNLIRKAKCFLFCTI